MSGLPEEDQLKLAKAAAWRDEIQEECDQVNQDLEVVHTADDSSLLAWISDSGCPTVRRRNAFMVALGRRLVSDAQSLRLMDDPDDELSGMAIRYAPVDIPEVTERLRSFLDDPRPKYWSSAATSLSRRKDPAAISRVTEWFRSGDEIHRNVAWGCITSGLLDPDQARVLLHEAWIAAIHDDFRVLVACSLLGYGDRTGWSFLVDHARKAESYSACWVAQVVERHDRRLGLELMRHILDHGASFEVRWGMVEKLSKCAGLGHTWTADGLAEARFWIEQRLTALGGAGATPSEGAA